MLHVRSFDPIDLDDFKGRQAVVIAWFPKAFTGG
jgi:peroxiredoxin